MKRVVTLFFLISIFASLNLFSQQDGNNNLFGVPKISLGRNATDTLLAVAGRSIEFVPGPKSLDGDDLADIIVPDYNDGGRVHVFEQVSKNSLEFKLVWSSPKKKPRANGAISPGPSSTPRMVTYGDLDGNGKNEVLMPLGYAVTDTVLSDTTWPRGVHVYECIGDNNYGTAPFIIRPEQFDPTTVNIPFGRMEKPGMIAADIDNDGKQELVCGSFTFVFDKDIKKNAGKAYILRLKSGSFAAKNAVFEVEYLYDAMAKAIGDTDGYVPTGFTLADVDGDGKNEIVIAGRTNIGYGASIGFLKATAPDTYTPGNIVNITVNNLNVFRVTSVFGKMKYEGKDVVFFNTDEASGDNRIMLMQDIVDIALAGINNFNVIKKGQFGSFTGTAVGDQDHGTGSDGFDIYFPKGVTGIYDLEYKGSGNIADSANYTLTQIFDAKKVFKNGNGGLYHIIVPPSDLNNNGRKEIIANFQIYGPDTVVNGNIPVRATSPFFIIEWGDTTMGTVSVQPLTIYTTEDYKLEQNYPNPFNPSTTIRFSIPTPENISLIIYDINGKEVKRIIDNQKYEKGAYEAIWDGRNQYGNTVASGVYFYKLKWGNFEKSMKMTLLK